MEVKSFAEAAEYPKTKPETVNEKHLPTVYGHRPFRVCYYTRIIRLRDLWDQEMPCSDCRKPTSYGTG
jgi:hypothetical protein